MTVKPAHARTARLLVVDDDARLRRLIAATLTKHGFWVEQAASTAEAEALRAAARFDLLLCDVMMAGESGLAYTQRLREEGDTVPILLLTALGETPQRIEGLSAGADDYLAKPFEPAELVLRLQAILRRLPPPPLPLDSEIIFAGYHFQPATRQLFSGGETSTLTEVEAGVLALLAARLGYTVTRREIAQLMGNDTDSRAVDVTITRLRKKMERGGTPPDCLHTVRGEGYRLVG